MMPDVNSSDCDELSLQGLTLKQYTTIWTSLYAVIFVPTVFGNSLILVSIARFHVLRTNIYILIGNLAIADLLVGAVLIPLDTLGDIANLHSKYYCLTKLTVFVLTLGGSCFNLFLISVERFSSVVFPLRHSCFTKRKLYVSVAVGWMYVSGLALLPLLGCNNYEGDEELVCNASVVWGETCLHFMNGNFVVIMFLNIALYAVVIRIALKKASTEAVPGQLPPHHHDLSKTLTMAAVLGTFTVFWTPYAFLTLLITVLNSQCFEILFFIRRWALMLGILNSAVNWVIYGFRNNHFREAFRAVMTCNVGGNHLDFYDSHADTARTSLQP